MTNNHLTLRKQTAIALIQSGQIQKAKGTIEKLCARYKNDAELWYLLGTANGQMGLTETALDCFRNAVAIRPSYAEAYFGIGETFANMGQLKEAITHYHGAIVHNPSGFAIFYSRLGHALNLYGRPDEAIPYYLHSLKLQPNDPDTCNFLGVLYKNKGRVHEAIRLFKQARACAPENPTAYHNLGGCYTELGQYDEAIKQYRKAINLYPDLYNSHSGILFALNYKPSLDPEQKLREHKLWSERHALFTPTFRAGNYLAAPDRRLRIGYVSADFRRHSVAYFFSPLLEYRNPNSTEIYCYSNTTKPDEVTSQLKEQSDHWRDISNLDDNVVCSMIAEDQIDILVDLGGHTEGNRLRLFAMKPAPVQVSYLGYPSTTGLAAIDYRLTDALADPVGLTEQFHTETLCRLPNGFLCYQPPAVQCRIEASSPSTTGQVTFGSFNNLAKISPDVVRVWSAVLKAVPGSSLLLKYYHLGTPETNEYFIRMFAENDIPRERLEFLPHSKRLEDHLATYNRVDIALDTFPYNGTTTTCEALWMGVPTITLAGNQHAARVGVSLLSRTGLTDFIADSTDNYINIAKFWAERGDDLSSLRNTLRDRMLHSPLCDQKTLVQDIENAYRSMWKQWCANAK